MSVDSPTVIEAAPTEIETISISSSNGSDAGDVAVIANPPWYGGWVGRITRFAGVLEASSRCTIALWDLLAFSIADDADAQFAHCMDVMDYLLGRGYIAGFKIGITHLPFDRAEAYKLEGYYQFRVMSVHDDANRITALEQKVIAEFRRYGPGGQLVSLDGHVLCLNRNPGGESGDHGLAPFCCYVALK